MIPVTQDIFGEKGNCMAACVASIFELSLKQVPNFADPTTAKGDWFRIFWEFVHSLGYEPIYWSAEGEGSLIDFDNLPEHLMCIQPFYLQCGPAERGFSHATVGWKGHVIHDPYPSRAGLKSVNHYYFFKKLKEKEIIP